MAGDAGKLTAVKVRSAGPGKHFDGGGLYLHVKEQGRYWRLKYRVAGREKLLALGVFPEVSLAEARQRREEARSVIRHGGDPAANRRAQKAAALESAANSFEALAAEWLGRQARDMAPKTYAKAERVFSQMLNPWVGQIPVDQVTPQEMLKALRRIESQGKHETAARAKQRASQVFRYAIATGRATSDPTQPLRGALIPAKVTNRAAITDERLMGQLMRAIDGYEGDLVTRCALQFVALTFARPGEVRGAEWAEIDLDRAEWLIPAERMKMKREHVVPLSAQAVAVLRELEPLTGRGRYVFPGRAGNRPLSDVTLNAALRRMGFDKHTMTAHGFRGMASTRLNEMAWPADVIERQLAHVPKDKIRGAYNKAQHLPDRVRMMQAWADYLDAIRSTGKVVPIHRERAG
ncbi:tyrosine-type recombinase/integrase [Arenimonas aestuarii]